MHDGSDLDCIITARVEKEAVIAASEAEIVMRRLQFLDIS
jgi:hypothetical protein